MWFYLIKNNKSQQQFMQEQKHRQYWNRWSISISLMIAEFNFQYNFSLYYARNVKSLLFLGIYELVT